MNDIVGKTVASIAVKTMAGRDTYKDWVMWERTVITFTDNTSVTFDSWDGEVFDEFEHDGVDENGNPINHDGWIQLDLEITNIYEDGEEVVTYEQVWVPDPPDTEGDQNLDEFDEWTQEYIYPLTGTGREDGDAGYFAEVKAVKGDQLNFGEHPLVGRTFEFGT